MLSFADVRLQDNQVEKSPSNLKMLSSAEVSGFYRNDSPVSSCLWKYYLCSLLIDARHVRV
jgi:hypothetical protein